MGKGYQKSLELDGYLRPLAKEMGAAYLNPGGQVAVSQEDGIHYTVEGHARMAELVKEEVLRILGD